MSRDPRIARLDEIGFPTLAGILEEEGVGSLADTLAYLDDCYRNHDEDPRPEVYSEARAIVRALLP